MLRVGLLLGLLILLAPGVGTGMAAEESGPATVKLYYTGNNWGYLETCPT